MSRNRMPRGIYEHPLNIQKDSDYQPEHSCDLLNHPRVSDKYLRGGWGIITECIRLISILDTFWNIHYII